MNLLIVRYLKITIFTALLIVAANINSQSFSDFIEDLEALPLDERQAKVDSFMFFTSTFPFTEDTLAHFVYSDTGTSLAVPGDFSSWDPGNAIMTNIEGTDFWFRTYSFKNDARLEYKFVCDETNWILDPENPNTFTGGYGKNSELRMPMYIPPEEVQWDPSRAHGTFEVEPFASANLQNTRDVKIYLPPGYDESVFENNLVLVHDGQDYISFANMKNVLDHLHAKNLIDPTIAVFIPPIDRDAEYVGFKKEAFTNFIIYEVMPWLELNYRIKDEPECHATIGSSAGGNIALWLGMNHPDIFGKIGAFSSYIEESIRVFFSTSDTLGLRIYMNHGIYDHIDLIQQSVESFVPILEEKGYDYLYKEYPEGHSYGFWRAYLDEALIFFFPETGYGIEEDINIPSNDPIDLYPNPCSNELTVKYHVKDAENLNIELFDISGNYIQSLVNTNKLIQYQEINIDVSGLNPGIYIFSICTKEQVLTCKFVKIP